MTRPGQAAQAAFRFVVCTKLRTTRGTPAKSPRVATLIVTRVLKRAARQTERRLMFDPILKKSIQRWEYEGGRVLRTHDGNHLETIDRNNSYRSWNRINRVESEEGFDVRKSSRNRPESPVHPMA